MRTLSIANVLAAIDDEFQPVNTLEYDPLFDEADPDACVDGILPDVNGAGFDQHVAFMPIKRRRR